MLLKKYFVAIVFFILLITTLLQYKLLSSQKLNKTILRTPLYSDVDKELDSIIRKIPVGASVSTQDYISGNLTQRRQLYLFPVYSEKVDYLLLSVAQSTWPLEPAEQSKLIAKFKNDKHHRVLYESKNFILMKRE